VTDAPDSPDAPRSWWESPATFTTRLAAYNAEQKRLGDSELPPPVRDYLLRVERAQHAEASELPVRPT